MARNQYAGPCYRCGLTVEVGTGHFEKKRSGIGFRVQHGLVVGHGRVTCEQAKTATRAAALKALADGPRAARDVPRGAAGLSRIIEQSLT